MYQLRQILYSLTVLTAWYATPAQAAPPLTQIQDVLYRADGTPFTGAVTITWRSFTASDTASIPANVLTIQIVDGLLPAGLHETWWNGRDDFGRPLPSGIYIVELRAGTRRVTQRLVLTR